jgi:hypothetical protein
LDSYLEYHFNSEDSGEHVVEVVEYLVALRLFSHRVLSSQSHAGCANDDHDEQIEVAKIHYEVAKTANSEKQKRKKGPFGNKRLAFHSLF